MTLLPVARGEAAWGKPTVALLALAAFVLAGALSPAAVLLPGVAYAAAAAVILPVLRGVRSPRAALGACDLAAVVVWAAFSALFDGEAGRLFQAHAAVAVGPLFVATACLGRLLPR